MTDGQPTGTAAPAKELYLLPEDGSQMGIDTVLGHLVLVSWEANYFARRAIFVHTPAFAFDERLAAALADPQFSRAFYEATGHEFCIHPSPSTALGGSDLAVAIVSAGLSSRHCRESRPRHTGYFANPDQSAPRMDVTAEILTRLIAEFYGSPAAADSGA